MRIGIDATAICDANGGIGAGVNHVVFSLVEGLIEHTSHSFVIGVPAVFPEERVHVWKKTGRVSVWRVSQKPFPFVGRHVLLPLYWMMKRVDVVLSPHGQTPMAWRGKSVVYVHDASIFEHPEWFPDVSVRSFVTQSLVPRSIARATKLCAVSEFTREQMGRVMSLNPATVSVVYPGIAPVISPKIKVQKERVLVLGTIEPRKNIETALRAWDLFLRSHPEFVRTSVLRLVGKRGWKTDGVDALVQSVNAQWHEQSPEGVVELVGAVSEEDKWQELANAKVLLFPSLEEGFGLPVLEAMSAGIPVISSDRGALPEVGGETVLYTHPLDAENIALLLAQIFYMPEAIDPLLTEAKKRAEFFTVSRMVDEMVGVIIDILAKK